MKPTHVINAETFLRENLVGEILPKRYQSIVGDFVLESSLRPGAALEDITLTLLRRRFKGAGVHLEPFGRETFPDLALQFSSDHRILFEVKSKSSMKRKYEVDLASMKHMLLMGLEGDSRYWETYYFIWSFVETSQGFQITDLECDLLWKLAGKTESGALRLGSGSSSGRTRYIQRLSQGFDTPHEFLDALVKVYEQAGVKKADWKAFQRISTKMIKAHNL